MLVDRCPQQLRRSRRTQSHRSVRGEHVVVAPSVDCCGLCCDAVQTNAAVTTRPDRHGLGLPGHLDHTRLLRSKPREHGCGSDPLPVSPSITRRCVDKRPPYRRQGAQMARSETLIASADGQIWTLLATVWGVGSEPRQLGELVLCDVDHVRAATCGSGLEGRCTGTVHEPPTGTSRSS